MATKKDLTKMSIEELNALSNELEAEKIKIREQRLEIAAVRNDKLLAEQEIERGQADGRAQTVGL